MSCENVQQLISLLLDRRLAAEERGMVLSHLSWCRTCTSYLDDAQRLRGRMLEMNGMRVPPVLHSRLRVIASHEQQRLILHSSIRRFTRYWADRVRLAFDNLMRPVALPFAGGSLSALLMFCMLVPSLSFPHNFTDQALLTDPYGSVVLWSSNGPLAPPDSGNFPRIQRLDQDTPDDANVVELTIDQAGKVSDFSLTHGKLTEDLKSIIIFSQFTPATLLGLPTSGKVKAVQRNLAGNLRS